VTGRAGRSITAGEDQKDRERGQDRARFCRIAGRLEGALDGSGETAARQLFVGEGL
jgi:hypothetical protein